VICDEAHKQEFNPYFEQDAFPKNVVILGFSATPMRSGKQRQLADDFEIMIEGLQVPELIKRGRLVKDRYFGVKQHADMSGVRMNSFGDYQESGMFERFNKRELYQGAVKNWKELTPDTVTLVFCVNIQHTIETCKEFNRAGIDAMFLTSDVALPRMGSGEAAKVRYDEKMRDYENWKDAYLKYSGERNSILRRWRENKFKVLVNAGILTTGFNRKDIETIVINRATTSTPLWLQMLGRGSRTYPGKQHFNILDFGDNARNLGYYNQQRQWSLWHEQRGGDGAPPVKSCGGGDPISGKEGKPDKNGRRGCGSYIFASTMICPYCGYIFEQQKQEKFADLIEIEYSKPISFEKSLYEKLDREAEHRGYKFGWVLNRIIAEEGEQGLIDYSEHRQKKDPGKFGRHWVEYTKKRYAKQIESYNSKQSGA